MFRRSVIGVFTFSLVVVSTFSFSIEANAATGINEQISFQGKVVNTNGTNVANGSYTFVFRLYDVSSGGTHIWTESKSLTVTDGIFQTNLGDTTTLPGSVDFNTDNIYLGINFNSDGEMTPRVRFTAAPYALNAAKVGGLTVTDTTGTLTIPNSETISFGGSFTTSASNDVTLTTSGATNVTLPTTGTLATLAGSEIFTNKTIGSTGLTFSGSTTDITTASGESLVLTAAGAGTIDLQDAVTADSLTLDSGGLTLQNSETIGNSTDDIIAFTGTSGADNTDLFLDLDGTSPVLYSNTDVRISVDDFLNVQVSGVSGAAAGDIWYDSAAQKFKVNENGTTKTLCNTTDLGCGSGGGMSIGGTVTSGTTGSILFIGASSALAQDNANFFFDDTNNRLGLGDVTPDAVLDFDFTSTSGTAGTEYGSFFTVTDTGAVSTGSDITYGNRTSVTRSGATGGNITVYGQSIDVSNTFASGSGNAFTYGQYITATGSATGSSTATGLNAIASNADNNTGSTFTVSGGTGTNYGVDVIVVEGTGTLANAYGTNITIDSSDGGITTAYGTRIALTASFGSIGTGYGVYLDDVAATTDYGIYQAGSNDDNILFGSTNIGGDTTPNALFTVGNTSQFQVNSSGAIAAATGITSSGTITFSGLSAGGVVQAASGTGVLSVGTIGASSITADSLDFTEFQDQLDLDASTDILADGSEVLSITNTGTGNSFLVNDASGDTTPFVIDAAGNVGIGLSSPGTQLFIDSDDGNIKFGTSVFANKTVSTDTGIELSDSGRLRSGLFTEVDGSILSYAINSVQIGDRNTGTVGGIFRLDTRTGNGELAGDQSFIVFGVPTGGSTESARLVVNLQNGNTYLAPSGGNITAGDGSGTFALNSSNIDISSGGAITGATGVSTTTVTATSTIDARGDISDSTGNLTLNDAVDISGALAVSGTSLTATSATTITLGSTGADTIILGNAGADTITIGNVASTGVSIVDNNWSVTTAGLATFITGTVIGSQTFTTNNIADSGALTIASGSGTALTLNSGTTGTINIGTDASAETINIGNTGAAVKTIAIGNNSQANTITIGDFSVTNLSLADNNWSISTAGVAAFVSLSSSSAIAANGGITFDAATDTVGAFTAAGTIDLNTNILTNIGNSGTDFVASTGALTLAGVLTANGGITLAGSQTFTGSALSYVDLGAITHGTTAVQGIRLPQAASASPSNPTSGEGYLAWDSAGNQLITYNGSSWSAVGGGGMSIGGTVTSGTTGSILFVGGSSALAQDNANFFFDDTNNRLGLGDTTPDATLDFDFASTNGTAGTEYGSYFTVSDTGAVSTGTDATYGNRTSVTRTGATGGSLNTFGQYVDATGTFASGSGNAATFGINVSATGSTTGTTETRGIYAAASGADTNQGGYFAANDNIATGFYTEVYPTNGGNGTGVDIYLEESSTTANTNTGVNALISSLGNVSSGTDTTYGGNFSVTRSGASGGTINNYGLNVAVTGDTGGTSTNYGAYVAVSGADTNYSGIFTGGNFGIGDTTPDALLDFDLISTSATAATEYGAYFSVSDTGAVTSGTDTTYGAYTSVARSGASGTAAVFTYGNQVTVSNSLSSGSGTAYSYGYNTSVTGSAVGTSAAYGLYAYVQTADSNTGAYIEIDHTDSTGIGIATDLYASDYGSTANTVYGSRLQIDDESDVSSGTDTTYGGNIVVNRNSALGGTIDTYGLNVAVTGDAGGTSTVRGLTVAVSGADTNYSGIFTGGNFGIGDTTPTALLTVGTSDAFQVNSSGAIAATTGITSSGTIAANGGITLAGSQSFAASALAYMDLGAIVHNTTANQGLRLPQAASASPSNPTSGEGYLAWDAAGNQLITYNGSAWSTIGGGGYNLIKDESTSLTVRTTLAFIGAGVSCADNASQTECTIAGGSGADLQGTYDTDANGSNATISLTAADDGLVFTNPTSGGNDLSAFLLSLTQQNTTAGIVVLDMVQSSNAANGANLAANSIDTETGLAITTNGLTSGKGISITSSVASNFTGNLADIQLTGSGASNTGNVLAVSNTGTANANTSFFVDHRATGTGNLAMRVNDESGDTTPFIIDGNGRVGIATAAISDTATTERLLQVGSETTRGNNVTYGEVVTKGLKGMNALTDIKDIFMYDTTTDSDGGRWIDWATTDRLSWYSEALDDGPNDLCNIATDDRCYSKSFPRKAILVVTGSALYIFDATNNIMWMKFDQNASGYALGVDTNNNPSSVTAMNGVVYVGAKGTASGGLYAIDFVNDRMWNYNATHRAGANVGISGRNAAVTYASDAKTALQLDPVGTSAEWMNINDVDAVSVNSSLSATTSGAATNLTAGNGQSFVALATDSGVTIINLAAQKLLQYSDVTADNYEAVELTKSGRMYALNSTSDQLEKWDNIDSDKTSEVNGTFTSRFTSAVGPALAVGTVVVQTDAPDALEVVERGSLALETMDLIYVGHSLGLTEIHDHSTVTNGWSKFYNTTRQTMLMPNAIDTALMLDETSGTVAQDASFNNTDMSYKGTFTLGANGVRGKGVGLNGTGYLCSDADANGTCDVDTAFNMSTTGWTTTMWFKHSTTAPVATQVLFDKCYTAVPAQATGCVQAYMTTSGTIGVGVDDDATWTLGSSYDVTATSSLTYNDDQWHFLVISRTNANDVDVYIDGQALNLSTATGLTITFDGSQIVALGAACSAAANCGTGANFWDGSIDDFTFSAGATTVATVSGSQQRRLYNDARPLVGKRTITVDNATSGTANSITDTSETWIPNEFAGLIVTLTGGTGSGQSRRVTGNTTDTLSVSPDFDVAPSTDTDFEVDPEALYGASDIVTAIGITAESPLGEARMMCAGTNSGTDTGGVTCYNHQAGPNVVAEVFHADAKKVDDLGGEWTGTDYDDIKSIDLSGRSMVIGTMAHTYTRTEDVRLGQGLDYIASQLFNIRGEIIQDGITAAGSLALEIGFTGGADLAERYYSNEPLQAGEVVAIDSSLSAGVKKTTGRYQRDAIGIVATEPGLILGAEAENGYPIALVGRVPVRVTNENGPIYTGDRVTAASRPGHAMRATQAGRVLGAALADAVDWAVCEGEDPMNRDAVLCTTVMVFVNLTDYAGQPVELAMAEKEKSDAAALETAVGDEEVGLSGAGASVRLASAVPTREEKIMAFLKEIRDERARSAAGQSEVFTDRVAASTEIITPRLVVDEIFAKSIKADNIEGLSIWTNQIASLEAKYAGLAAGASGDAAVDVSGTKEKTLLNLEQFSVGSIAVAFDASILGKLSVTGALQVIDAAEFQGETTFASLASFLSDTIFKGRAVFEAVPTFSADTAGFAVIEKGERKVRITFTQVYEKQPIVTVSLTRDASPLLGNEADDELRADVAAVEKDFLDTVFDADVRYIITGKDEAGFTILLSEEAPADLQFSWVAIAVDQAQSFVSEKSKEDEDTMNNEELPSIESPVPAVAPEEVLEPVSPEAPEEIISTSPEVASESVI